MHISEEWFDLVGITPGEDRGWGWADVVHPEDREQYLHAWTEAIRTGRPCEREYRVAYSDVVCAIHELPPGTALSLGEALAYYEPTWRERMRAVSDACVRAGMPYDEEPELITTDGSHLHVRVIGEAVSDASGRFRQLRVRCRTSTNTSRRARRSTASPSG